MEARYATKLSGQPKTIYSSEKKRKTSGREKKGRFDGTVDTPVILNVEISCYLEED